MHQRNSPNLSERDSGGLLTREIVPDFGRLS